MCWVDKQKLVFGELYFGVSDIKSNKILGADLGEGRHLEARGWMGLGDGFSWWEFDKWGRSGCMLLRGGIGA